MNSQKNEEHNKKMIWLLKTYGRCKQNDIFWNMESRRRRYLISRVKILKNVILIITSNENYDL